MAPTPAGWYDDGHGALRWWDGAQWTEHVHEAAQAAAGGEAAAEGAAPGVQTPTPAGYASAPAAAPAKRKSRLWILWAVLGAVVVLLVVLAAVLIPALINAVTSSGGAAGTGGGGGGASDARQQGAVAAVELYDDAYSGVDCDAFTRSTTEAYRESSGFTDCAVFEEQAQSFTATLENYRLEVSDVQDDGEAVSVTTVETYDSLVDEEGEPLAEPIPAEDDYVYTVVQEDGTWRIDDLQVVE